MLIKVKDNQERTITWEVIGHGPLETKVRQVDSRGEYEILFSNVHHACQWAIDQADYVVRDMDYRYVL
jgi:hypothetical protein